MNIEKLKGKIGDILLISPDEEFGDYDESHIAKQCILKDSYYYVSLDKNRKLTDPDEPISIQYSCRMWDEDENKYTLFCVFHGDSIIANLTTGEWFQEIEVPKEF